MLFALKRMTVGIKSFATICVWLDMNPFFIWSSNSFACDLCTLFLHVHKNMNGMKYQIDMIHGFFGVKEKTEQL